MSESVSMDDRLWPLVRFKLEGEVGDDGWRHVFAHYERLYERRQRFAVVTESTRLLSVPSAAARKYIGETSKMHEPMSREWVVCSCVVIDSALLRGALRAITWVNEPVYPLHHVATLGEGVLRSTDALLAEGVELPEALAAYRREHSGT